MSERYSNEDERYSNEEVHSNAVSWCTFEIREKTYAYRRFRKAVSETPKWKEC